MRRLIAGLLGGLLGAILVAIVAGRGQSSGGDAGPDAGPDRDGVMRGAPEPSRPAPAGHQIEPPAIRPPRLTAPPRPWLAMETAFFLVLGLGGLGTTVVYWFITYEVAGSVLLFAFGLAMTLVAASLLRAQPDHPVADGTALDVAGAVTQPADSHGDGRPFVDTLDRLPAKTLAPVLLALGVIQLVLAPVFGSWMIVLAIVPVALGARSWLSHAMAELDARREAERREAERREAVR